MKNTNSLILTRLLHLCLFLSVVFFSKNIKAQTQCNLGTLTLNVTNLTPDILGDALICPGSSTQLSLSQSFNGYLWSTGATSSTITANTSGAYAVTVINSFGCTATDEFLVTELPAFEPEITTLPLQCNGSATLNAGLGYYTYAWSNGGSTSTIVVNANGTYMVTVTTSDGCTGTDEITISLLASPVAAISGDLNFCTGGNTVLTASSGFSDYSWTGGSTGTSLTVTAAGTYGVTVTDANGCTASSTAVVTTSASTPPTISGNLDFCQGDSTTITAEGAGFNSYAWSSGQTTQSIIVSSPGNYTVTTTSSNGCTGTAVASLAIGMPPNVVISPIGSIICESNAPFNLSASPAGGVWSGDVGAGGSVNPATLGPGTWTASYEYTDANGCTSSDQLSFDIAAGTSPSIAAAGPFCPTEGVQTLTATPAGGTWGGAANALGQINPLVLGPGVYPVTYNAAASGNCASNTQITITVSDPPTAVISGSGNICVGNGQSVPIVITAAGNGPFEVNYTIGGAMPTTVNVPVGTTNLNASTAGTYDIVTITDAIGCTGSGSGQAEITTVTAPIAINVDVTCDALQSSYQVLFNIIDGDSASYFVNSVIPGILSSGTPYVYTSGLIASGNSYQFEISDANGCNPTVLAGSFNCNCGTNAGSMDATPLVLCVGETATAQLVGSAQLDPDDLLRYYLHDVNGSSLGTVFDISTTPSFDFAPPLVAGQTYYISAVAGDGNGAGSIDLNAPCLSVSIGTPVTWEAALSGSLSAGPAICKGEAATLVFSLSGSAPFNVTYSDGSQSLALQNIQDGHSITVSPTATTTYTLGSVEDSSPAGCSSSLGNSFTITVSSPDTTALQATSCVPAEVGVFTNVFTNQNGCDSTVILTVNFQSFDEVFLNTTTCDPAMAGVFTDIFTNQNGCDSVVTTTVTLVQSDLTELSATTCDPAMAGVFTDVFTNQSGCDSVVTTTVTLVQSNLTELAATTCDPTMAGVFTDTYINQNGCDSVVVVTVSLLPADACNVSFQLAAAVIPCGSNGGSILIEVEQGQLPLAYIYSGPGGTSDSGLVTSSSFNMPPLPAGQYSITLTDTNGLSATEMIEVVQATAPSVTIELLNGLPCSGELLASLSANVTGAFPPYNLVWTNGASTSTISNLGAGDYGVIVTGDFGCEATATVAVTELPSLVIGFTVSNPDCFENSNGSVTVNVTGGQSPYQYSLNNMTFQNGNSFYDLTVGAYQIIVKDGNGCKMTASFAINAPLVPQVSLGNDMVIDAGDGATINAIVNLSDSLIASIVWTGLAQDSECPTCLVQPTAPLVTSTYSIVVESVDGCTDSDDITVYVKKERQVYVPNAFSPDSDGVNDVFYPFAKNDSVEKINSFLVFSRWGETVFSANDFQPNDPTHGWDGKHRGQVLDAGVFVWYAEIKFKDGEVALFEGDVTLMR